MLDHKYIGSIDPGLTCTGIAVWDAEKWSKDAKVKPVWVGYVYPKWHHWQGKADKATEYAVGAWKARKWNSTYIEFPQYQGTTKGIAAQNKGDILKLASLCGQITGALGVPSVYISPHDWKRQLPKKVTRERLKEIVGAKWIERNKKRLNEHVWDAIGIGYYVQGIKII